MLVSLFAKGQTLTVLDKNDTPVSFVHVSFIYADNSESIMVSDERGRVQIPKAINNGAGVLTRISHISYLNFIDTLIFTSDLTVRLEPSKTRLDQVVITGQIIQNNAEDAIQKIRTIDRVRIESQGAVTLRNILEQETNIRLSQDNILGSSLSIQGVSGQNVKILIDGVPVVGRLNGNIDVDQINLTNIERIEIVEGPLSVNYGSNALAGTINLITKQYKGPNIMVKSYYETVGKYNVDGLANISLNNHQFSFSGGRNYFDGWSPGDGFRLIPKATIADTTRFKQWKPKEQYFARIQDLFKRNSSSIRLYADFFHEEILNRGLPRQPYDETAFDDVYKTQRNSVGLDFKTKVKDKNINILLSHNRYKRSKNTFFTNLTNLDAVLSENNADQDTAFFNSIMSRGGLGGEFIDRLSAEIGYDVMIEQAKGVRIARGTQTQGDFAMYSNIEWSLAEGLVIRPGLRWSYNTNYNAPLVPSIHIKYEFQNLKLRSSFAKGFRSPSLKELYFEFVDINHNIVGNPDLKPETSNNYQVSLDWKRARNNSTVGCDVSAFYNDMNDLITLANTSLDSYAYINIGNYKTFGTKTNLHLTRMFLRFNSGLAYIARQNNIQASEAAGLYSYSLEVKSNITYEIAKWNSEVAIFYKNTGALPSFWLDSEGEVRESTIDGYQIMDLTYSWSAPEDKFKVVIGCKNALDIQNTNTISGNPTIHQSSTISTSIGYGRTFFTSFKWNLK